MNQYQYDNLDPSDLFLGNYQENTCNHCITHDQNMDLIADYLSGVIDELGKIGELHHYRLRSDLSEIARIIGASDIVDRLKGPLKEKSR